MTPRERVEAALRRERVDKVPFTTYESKLPTGAAERALRSRGLCIVKRLGLHRVHTPNVRHTQEVWWEGDRRLVRDHYETPAGHLTSLSQPESFTTWTLEKLFKTPDDYPALLALIRDQQFDADYDAAARAEKQYGEDATLRGGIAYEPLQQLISGGYLGTQDFCVQWMDHRDEILRLYDALADNHRRIYPIVAGAPGVFHVNYGGNVVPEIIGPAVFEKYYVPRYNEAAEVLHRHGKLIGSHFDANCRQLARLIAGTGLDYVEAFTPSPDTNMTLADARAAWPDKVLWINFPSSVHLWPDADIERFTVDLLRQVDSVDGLLFGITEDVPEERWQGSYRAIMDGLERDARERPDLYRAGGTDCRRRA